MVHYITDGKYRPISLKARVLIGGLAVATLGSFCFGLHQYMTRQQDVATIVQEKSGVPDQHETQYQGSVDAVIEGLDKHPNLANLVIRESISSLERNGNDIDPDTYLMMFDEIREKAEQNPEIMDHFGPNALEYQENRFLRKYSKKIEEAYQKSREKLEDAISSIKENEHIKDAYNHFVEGVRSIFRQGAVQ